MHLILHEESVVMTVIVALLQFFIADEIFQRMFTIIEVSKYHKEINLKVLIICFWVSMKSMRFQKKAL